MDNTMHTTTIESTTDGICSMLAALAYASEVAEDNYEKALVENDVKNLAIYRELSMKFSKTYKSFLRSVRDQFPEVYILFIRDFYAGEIVDHLEDSLDF